MKYLYIGISILALTLLASIILVVCLNNCIHRTAKLLDEALEACDRNDMEQAYRKGMEAERLWNKYDGFLGVALDHEESDGITFGVAEMNSYAITDTPEDFRRCCAEVNAQMYHVAQKELPYYFNLF